MSEVKQEEPVKQEGEFKLKKKTPKKLTKTSDEPVRVNIKEPLVELEPEVKKVVIPRARRGYTDRRNKRFSCGKTNHRSS